LGGAFRRGRRRRQGLLFFFLSRNLLNGVAFRSVLSFAAVAAGGNVVFWIFVYLFDDCLVAFDLFGWLGLGFFPGRIRRAALDRRRVVLGVADEVLRVFIYKYIPSINRRTSLE
jgi:hypothetical protein